ncbi:MAG: GIY-YIG nuclease family protein, partial [Paracoccaceae bacterium]|nr:GIY-YIG nuclease family protein [Paracoccaceae bacterium]
LADAEELDDDALLAELGIEVEAPPITELKHVRSTAEKKAAEEIAHREKCEDFETFKPLFEQVQKELATGLRETRPFERDIDIAAGQFFIVGGVKAFIGSLEEEFVTPEGRPNRRMRVIFDNGTESRALMRSFQRSLYKDENTGRRITEPTAGPLFSDQTIDGDEASGTIYVLRSKSDHPLVAENRELVHKIGVTNMSVEKRVAGAQLQPTFLMANVEIVATYELYNINRTKLENLIHRIFEPARLEIEIMDRFGRPVVPREWFLVPLFVIKEAVELIKDGTISAYCYDPDGAALLRRG